MSKIINVDIKKFSYSKETILKDITFSVNKGEFIVITGLSGCGKTSLLRLLNGLVPALYDGNIIGQISILEKTGINIGCQLKEKGGTGYVEIELGKYYPHSGLELVPQE